MKASELKQGYYVSCVVPNISFVNTSHIYKSGEGNLCGTPALSNNWARIEEEKEIGCEKCLKKYLMEYIMNFK
jgi:hypothetical protein